MVDLRVDRPSDLLAVRFATSPVWETVHAVRSYAYRPRSAHQGPWLKAVAARAALLDLAPLLAVSPRVGYAPDFLTPPPTAAAPRFADQLAGVARTPPEQAREELARCRASLTDPERRAVLARLVDEPEAALDLLVTLVEQAWRALVEPYWPRISQLLAADIAYRSRELSGHGLGQVLGHLDRRVRWTGSAITVDSPGPDVVEPDPRGIVLMPSVFTWPAAVVVTDRPWQPTIVYPVRGIAGLWSTPQRDPVALARLLGATRAAVLAGLDAPASTTDLAARLGLSPSGASRHLVALRDAGLLTTARHGHEVRYRRTRLGTALLRSAGSREPETLR